MEGDCKLCGETGDLKLSHFIPKFVGKWVKESSATGYIRTSQNVNKRAQDIAKAYWLCEGCEQLFSGWERQFANKIFYPFIRGEVDEANYGGWLAKFCASISWRTLSYMRHLNPRQESERNEIEVAALNGLSSFLLDRSSNLGIYEQHFYPLEPVDKTNANFPPNLNRYLLRSMHMDVLDDGGQLLVFTKFPRFIILCLAGHSQAKQMRASRVAINGGRIQPRSYYWPPGFAEYLCGQAEKISKMYSDISPSQRAMIDKALADDPERVASSDTIAALRYDIDMFGDKAFR